MTKTCNDLIKAKHPRKKWRYCVDGDELNRREPILCIKCCVNCSRTSECKYVCPMVK